MPRNPKLRKALWGLLAVGLVFGAIVCLLAVPSTMNYHKFRADSARRLAAATTAEELAAATGRLGTVLWLPDRSWIAIRYTDAHVLPGWFSSSVALGSDGRWLQSARHYCGLIGAFNDMRYVRDQDAAWRAARGLPPDTSDTSDGEMGALFAADQAPSLEAARKILEDIGFSGYDADVKPVLTGPLDRPPEKEPR